MPLLQKTGHVVMSSLEKALCNVTRAQSLSGERLIIASLRCFSVVKSIQGLATLVIKMPDHLIFIVVKGITSDIENNPVLAIN